MGTALSEWLTAGLMGIGGLFMLLAAVGVLRLPSPVYGRSMISRHACEAGWMRQGCGCDCNSLRRKQGTP